MKKMGVRENKTHAKISWTKVYRKWLILGLKVENQLRNKNHTEDWTLGCHPAENGHVTH